MVIVTAGYILWAIQRVYLGAEYRGPHPEALTPITMRELLIASPLFALAIIFGVYPRSILYYMQPSVDRQVEQLAVWTKSYDDAGKEATKPLGEDGEQLSAVGLLRDAPKVN